MCLNIFNEIKIEEVENNYTSLFCTSFKFSNSLTKYTDINLPDKYDHNYFAYVGTPTNEEIDLAIRYQKDRNLNFVKLIGKEAINIEGFIDESINTMIYQGKQKITLPENIVVKKCESAEVIDLELRNFGQIYGEDFTRRNIEDLLKHFDFIGIYEDNILRGHCYIHKYGGYTQLDGLVIDEPFRHQKFATKLLLSVCNKRTFLHVNVDEPIKDFYLKLGFKVIGTSYQYRKEI